MLEFLGLMLILFCIAGVMVFVAMCLAIKLGFLPGVKLPWNK